ncbi:UNVERIFIED_CONTAM: hypothetical protein Sindi_1858600 [Sesamum indicum]
MASSNVGGDLESNSAGDSPGTPGTPGSNESDVPEEFYAFRDIICPELFRENVPRNTSALQGAEWVAEIMTTPHQGRFFDNIRMTKPCFYALVDALTCRGLLPHGQTSRVTSIEEVALFMQTVGMHKRHRDNMERFQHSLETIHRRFHRVFFALCAMAPELITRSDFTNTHPRVASTRDFYPYFKDCVGAMDGTLIPAWVPRVDQNRYRSRKGHLAQNVLAICDFDMNFTYVYAGWEGSAADARVLDHAVSQDQNFPFPPIGETMKYICYIASNILLKKKVGGTSGSPYDNIFLQRRDKVSPTRVEGTRSSLSDPTGHWGMPSYLQNHQVDIVIACCTLHNFIRRYSNDDIIFNEPDEDTPPDMDSFYHRGHPTTSKLEAQRTLRDNIALQMWAANHPNNPQ